MAGAILRSFTNNWWVLLLRGIFAILFGIMAFVWPGLTLVTLVTLYGIYALIDGITTIFVGISSKTWFLLLVGLLGVAVGIYAFASPLMTAMALLYVIAFWAIVRGILEIVSAIQVRKEIDNEWMLIIGGLFSILAGAILVISPGAGAMAMIWVIGAYALIFGVVMALLAFRVKGLNDRLEARAAPAEPSNP